MSLLAVLREAWPGAGARQETCFACRHFRDDAAHVEAALPGLAVLSSAHASVRAQDGLCVAHNRVINGRRRCAAFARHPEAPAPQTQSALLR